MAVKITIRTRRTDSTIPFMPPSLSKMYDGQLLERHRNNLLDQSLSVSEDGLEQTVTMIWRDLDSLMEWNQDRTGSQTVKEMMLLEYRHQMGIEYWSQQELI